MERLLVAGTGGTAGDATSMCMIQGYVAPLAATDAMREALEARGEDEVVDMLDEADAGHPPAGGLWVLECGMEPDDGADDENAWLASEPRWRPPTPGELGALLARQNMRATGIRVDPPDGDGRWAFLGALV